MRDNKGRFIKGVRSSPKTEFKQGEHWRGRKPFWEKKWLETEYVENKRSAGDIAREWGVEAAAIFYWLKKFNIPRRDRFEARRLSSDVRDVKGEKNGMFGRKGPLSPVWRGGVTPERQSFSASPDWKSVSRAVRKRDMGRCQLCGKLPCKRLGYVFHVHHRVQFDVKDLRLNIDNLVLLCSPCHRWVHSRSNIHRLFLGSFQMSLEGGIDGTVL